MIGYLKGEVIYKDEEQAVIVCSGVGYEVCMTASSLEHLHEGSSAQVWIKESISPYDGVVLYGFASREDRDLFLTLKEAVPNTGPKKALEYLNKAKRSLPDFQRAIISKDPRLLTGIFGFTAKTADKLIASLHDKMGGMAFAGTSKLGAAAGRNLPPALTQSLEALSALGYSPAEAKRAVEALYDEGVATDENAEALVRRALKKLAP